MKQGWERENRFLDDNWISFIGDNAGVDIF